MEEAGVKVPINRVAWVKSHNLKHSQPGFSFRMLVQHAELVPDLSALNYVEEPTLSVNQQASFYERKFCRVFAL
jgi:hypothetical protein